MNFFKGLYLQMIFNAESFHSLRDFLELALLVNKTEVVTHHFRITNELATLAVPLTSLALNLVQLCLPFFSNSLLHTLLFSYLTFSVY